MDSGLSFYDQIGSLRVQIFAQSFFRLRFSVDGDAMKLVPLLSDRQNTDVRRWWRHTWSIACQLQRATGFRAVPD